MNEDTKLGRSGGREYRLVIRAPNGSEPTVWFPVQTWTDLLCDVRQFRDMQRRGKLRYDAVAQVQTRPFCDVAWDEPRANVIRQHFGSAREPGSWNVGVAR
jgi:hypothetical protein